MIPVSLSFQAFESYAKMQTIDFNALSDGGIFLIHGETGAGKSAILDAITFALYHATSGGSRSQVKCFYQCAEELPTVVDFIFEAGGEKYRFYRSIRKKRNRKAGAFSKDDFVEEQFASKFTDGEWIPLEASQTQTSVTKNAQEILGLTVEQFRQVIILPQGQFERFLTSESNEKESILTTLFAAEKYTKISQQLRLLSAAEQKEISGKLQKARGLLESTGASSVEEAEAVLSALSEKNESLKSEYEKLSEETGLKEKDLADGNSLLLIFKKNDEYNERLKDFMRREPDIQAADRRLKTARLAASEKPLYNELQSTREEVKKREASMTEAQNKLCVSKEAFTAETEALKKLEEGIPETEALEKRLSSLEEKIPDYKAFDNAEKAFLSGEKKLSSIKENEAKLKNSSEASEKELLGSESKERELSELASSELPAISEKRARLSEGKTIAGKLASYRTLLETLLRDEKKAAEKLNTAAALVQDKRGLYDEAFVKRTSSLSAILAEALKNGVPCPVCGSVHHPSPAENTGEQVSDEEIKKLSSDLESAKDGETAASLELEKIRLRIQNGRQMIEEAESRLKVLEYTDKAYEETMAKYQELDKKLSELPKIREASKTLREKLLTQKSEADSVSRELLEETARFSKAEAEYNSLKSRRDSEFPDLDALIGFIEKSKQKLSLFKEELTSKQEKTRSAENEFHSAESGLRLSEKELSEAVKKEEKICGEFLSRLEISGFNSEEDWKKSCLDDNDIEEAQRKVTEFFTAYALCRTEKNSIELSLAGAIRPDIEALEDAFEASKNKKEAMGQELAVSAKEEERLAGILSSYKKQTEELTIKKREADEQARFASIMSGDTSQSFSRFVLGIKLDEIAFAANRTLKDVLGGQFQLFRKTDGEAKNKKTGLELEVLSALASSRYSVKNLSGGEKFLLSLSLSMALSSVLINQNGGMSIDALFIDEGFGSLDSRSLKEALSVLSTAVKNRSTVGIISHVSELTELIPKGLKITRDENGSRIDPY